VFDAQTKDEFMAISTTGIPAVPVQAIAAIGVRARVRRRISPQAGHALEILGHAIEYLTDEYVHEGGTFSAGDPRLEAIQILMSLNRQVYFACPEVPTLRERIRAWLHRGSAAGKTDTSTRFSF
jgi:hypothetical protein